MPPGRQPESADASRGVGLDRHVRRIRRIVVGVVGSSLLLVGLAMAVLPGPAIVVIPAALGLLSLEFAWARRLLRRVRAQSAGEAPPGEPEQRA